MQSEKNVPEFLSNLAVEIFKIIGILDFKNSVIILLCFLFIYLLPQDVSEQLITKTGTSNAYLFCTVVLASVLVNSIIFIKKNFFAWIENYYLEHKTYKLLGNISPSEKYLLDQFVIDGKSFIDIVPTSCFSIPFLKNNNILEKISDPDPISGKCRYVLTKVAKGVLDKHSKKRFNSEEYKKLRLML